MRHIILFIVSASGQISGWFSGVGDTGKIQYLLPTGIFDHLNPLIVRVLLSFFNSMYAWNILATVLANIAFSAPGERVGRRLQVAT